MPAPRSDHKPILSPLNCKSEPETPNEIASIAERVAQNVIKEATESVDSSSQTTPKVQKEEEPIPEIVVTESGPQITSDDEDIAEVEVKGEVKEDKVEEPKPEPVVADNTKIIEEPKVSLGDPFAEENEGEQDLTKLSSQPDDSVDGPSSSPSPSPSPSPKPRILAAERKKIGTAEVVKSEPPKAKPGPAAKPETKQKIYPTDLNPFGEEGEEGDPQFLDDIKSLSSKSVTSTKTSSSAASNQTPQKLYPTEMNPFGEEDEPETSNAADSTSESLNPFGDFEDEEEVVVAKPVALPTPSPRKTLTTTTTPPPPPPRSPRGVRSTPQKKRLAPAPPTAPNGASPAAKPPPCPPSPSLVKSAPPSEPACDTSSASSSRTPTPVPRRSKAPVQAESESPNSLESSTTPNAPPRTPQLKVKKRPAPPIPAFKRSIKSSVAEMDAELERIGDELPVVETSRLQLEHWLLEEQSRQRESNPDEEPTGQEYEDKLQEFIQFSIKRCKLAQKQKEFAYLKREHKLEEAQVEVEFNLRQIMSKQDTLKTEEDKTTEKELLDKLVEIIDERNEIIEAMVRAENLEIEEYIRMIAKVIPEQAKEMRPKPLHVPSTPVIQTPPEVQAKVHKHRSARKLLKNTTASTLSLLKLKKKKKKKDKNKDSSVDTTDGPVSPSVAVAPATTAATANESSDTEPENEGVNSQANSTGADDSLQASMASIDQIETAETAGGSSLAAATPPVTKDRSESRDSLPVESPKDVDPRKKKSAFSSLSKSTFKKFSPKIKASEIKSKLQSNNKAAPPSPDVPQKPAQCESSDPSETTVPLEANESTNVEQSNDDKPPVVSNGSTPKAAEPAESIHATQ